MSERTDIEYNLTVNVEDAANKIQQLERVLFRSLSLLRRMGLPEDVEAAITQTQRLITTLRMLQVTLNIINAASGPIGWALAGIGVASTVMTSIDTFNVGGGASGLGEVIAQETRGT